MPDPIVFNTSDGCRLMYRDEGAGPAIVLVPGWSMPASTWDLQLSGITGHRLVALDPRGQGLSQRTESGQYCERRARDIHELLEHLELQQCVLVGWSMAVTEVLTCAVEFAGDRIAGLVLVDGFVRLPPEHWAPGYASVRPLLRDRAAWTEAFMHSVTGPRASAADRNALSVESASMLPAGAYSLLLDYMFSDYTEILRRCKRPMLYAYHDMMEPQAQHIRDTVNSVRLENFSGCGHMLFRDEPDRFNRMLVEFVGTL